MRGAILTGLVAALMVDGGAAQAAGGWYRHTDPPAASYANGPADSPAPPQPVAADDYLDMLFDWSKPAENRR